MITFRFSSVALGCIILCGCNSDQAKRDAERIKELEQQVSALQSVRQKEKREESPFYSSPVVDRSWDPQGDLERKAEQYRAEAERIRLQSENSRLLREKAERELQENLFGHADR